MALRAKRQVVDPYGIHWGIYVTRSALPRDSALPGPYSRNTKIFDAPSSGDVMLGESGVLEALSFMIFGAILKLAGWPFRVFYRQAKGRQSGAIRIEAISLYGPREVRHWATTPDQLDGVLKEIADALEAGHVAQPVGAVYIGTREE